MGNGNVIHLTCLHCTVLKKYSLERWRPSSTPSSRPGEDECPQNGLEQIFPIKQLPSDNFQRAVDPDREHYPPALCQVDEMPLSLRTTCAMKVLRMTIGRKARLARFWHHPQSGENGSWQHVIICPDPVHAEDGESVVGVG